MNQQPLDVEDLRAEAKSLLDEQLRVSWEAWISGKPWDPEATMEAHLHLFAPQTLRRIDAAVAAGGEQERSRLEQLGRFLVWEAMSLETHDASEAYWLGTAAVRVVVEGEEYGLSAVSRAQERESDAKKRRAVWPSLRSGLTATAEAFLGLVEETRDFSEHFGFASPMAMAARICRVDEQEVLNAATATLDATEEEFQRRLGDASKAAGIEQPTLADVGFLVRVPDYPEAFPAAAALPLAGKTFAALGIDLGTQEGVATVLDPLGPGRSPRAFPLSVPGDVRIGVRPAAGLFFYRDLFFELGKAQHWAHCEATAWELCQPLGSRAIGGATGQLVMGLLGDAGFLGTHGLDPEAAKTLATAFALEQLSSLRVSAAQVLWHGSLAGGADPIESWASLGARALGVPLGPEDAAALSRRADAVFAVDDLQRRLLARGISQFLITKHGADWWNQKDAGRDLVEMWALGQRRNSAEWLDALGFGGGLAGVWAATPR